MFLSIVYRPRVDVQCIWRVERNKHRDMCAFFARPRRPLVRGYTPIITSFLLSIIIIGRQRRTRDGEE